MTLRTFRRVRNAALRRHVRIDVAFVSAALFILSALLLVTPSVTQSYIPPADFSPAPIPDWYVAGDLPILAGDVFSIHFVSSEVMTLGFVNSSSWDSYVSGLAASPVFVANATGFTGSFSLHAKADTTVTLVAHWNPVNMDYFKIILTAYDYSAFHPYAYLLFSLGAIAAGTALGYERLKLKASRFRSGRL